MLDTSCILGQEFQWVKGVRKWRGLALKGLKAASKRIQLKNIQIAWHLVTCGDRVQ